MHYSFNVLIMLCYKISTVFFESNSPGLLKSDHLPGISTSGTQTQGREGVLSEGVMEGGKGTHWGSAVGCC